MFLFKVNKKSEAPAEAIIAIAIPKNIWETATIICTVVPVFSTGKRRTSTIDRATTMIIIAGIINVFNIITSSKCTAEFKVLAVIQPPNVIRRSKSMTNFIRLDP
jgi:hypothetical protein